MVCRSRSACFTSTDGPPVECTSCRIRACNGVGRTKGRRAAGRGPAESAYTDGGLRSELGLNGAAAKTVGYLNSRCDNEGCGMR